MRRADLERAAIRLARALGERDCVLVGGLAVGAHGYVRGTRDVDFVVNMKLREAQRRLRDDHIPSTLARVALLEGDITWLRGTVGEVPFDILPAIVPIDWDASIAVPLGRATLRVVDLEGLLRLKVRAGGPRDLMDVAALVVRHPQRRERAEELAAAYGSADRLKTWLDDPRLRAEAAREETSTARQRGARNRGSRKVR